MAMTKTQHRPAADQEQAKDWAGPVTSPTWVGSHWRASLDLAADTVRHLLGDVGAWALWQKGIASAHQLEGRAGEPGLLACLRLGTHRLGLDVSYMLVARSHSTFVFAGGWRRHVRFIDVFAVEGDDRASTVTRELQVCISGRLRPLRSLMSAYLRRRVGSTFALVE